MENITCPLTRTARELYLRQAQNGDVLAMKTLSHAFADGYAGILNDLLGFISQVLSEPCLALAKASMPIRTPEEWMKQSVVLNGNRACEMVRFGLEAEYRRTRKPLPPALLRICVRVGAWATMFIQSTRILDPDNRPLVNEELLATSGMVGVLHAVFINHFTKDIMRHPSCPLYEVLVRVCIRISPGYTEVEKMRASDFCSIIIVAFQGCMRDPHPTGLWVTLERHAVDLAGIMVESVATYIGIPIGKGSKPLDNVEPQILQLAGVTVEVPALRRELSARGMLSLLCRLFHKEVREEVELDLGEKAHEDLMFLLNNHIQGINRFLAGGHPSAAVALEARILPNLIRTQALLDDPRGAGKIANLGLKQSIAGAIYNIEVQLFHSSALRAFRKSERYVKRLLAGGAIYKGVVWQGCLRLQSMAERRTREMEMMNMERVACANSPCTSTAKNVDAHIRRCSGCLTVEYCSRKCRRIHWTKGGHKKSCAAIRSLRDSGSTLVPPCTRDMNFIYFIIAQEMERKNLDILEKLKEFAKLKTLPEYPSGAIRGPFHTHMEDWIFADTVLMFDFAPSIFTITPTQTFEISFTVFSMEAFRKHLTQQEECDFDLQRIQESVEARRSRGPFVAIVLSSNLLDLTNRECIVNRVYSLDYFRSIK